MRKKLFTAFVTVVAACVLISCYQSPGNNARGGSEPVNYAPTTKKSPATVSNENNETKMNEKKSAIGFAANVPSGFTQPTDDVGRKLLKEYGAMFVARGGVIAPTKIVFSDEREVAAFQSRLSKSTENVGGMQMELQAAAMDDLRKAISDARSQGLSINPRDTDSARRSYDETVGLWKSRVDPALKHWVREGKMSQSEADKIASLSPFEQVPEILKLEEKGIYFAKDLSKSIIYSVAPPGTSQHLSMLAFDVKEFENEKIRTILAKHKWYQTVVSDLPHFTYLGVEESELPALGLKKTISGGRTFWVPDM